MRYRQCHLRKRLSETSHLEQVSYLPEVFAVVGRTLQLKDKAEGWVGGCVVLSAGSLIEGKLVETAAHDSKKIWAPSAGLTSRGRK